MRIDKFLSEMAVASRKDAAKEARRGGVLINGMPERDLSRHINPEIDIVTYLGNTVEYNRYIYIMLNKPSGYVSATDDKSLPYVTELLPDELRARELFPVGRLDRDTLGLILLTNDGVLAHLLLSPKRHVEKKYRFSVADSLVAGAEELFSRGITLRDGYECKPAGLECFAERQEGIITLTEGKYHQIKRMMGAVGNKITALERISFGGITLDESLERGQWRYLTDAEISLLRSQAK